MRKSLRVVPVAALAAVLVGLMPMSAQALSFTVSDDTPAAGQVLLLAGSGCAPSGDLSVRIGSIILKQTSADGSGEFVTSVRVPVFASAARHTLAVICENNYPPGSRVIVQTDIVVHRALTIFGRPARGNLVYMRGTGCVGSSTVRLRIDSRVLLTKTTLSTGSFSQQMAIPRATSLGTHRFYALCAQKDLPSATLVLGALGNVTAS